MIPTIILLALLAGALVYSGLTAIAALRYLAVQPPELRSAEPVSILKPLSGLDVDLESNLRTFFEQDYPSFEILLAVRDPDDPAIAVVEKLQAGVLQGAVALADHGRAAVSQRESFQPGPDAERQRARSCRHER